MSRLPRLPVPDLRKTLDRYLRSIQPLLLEDQERGGIPYDSAYALRVKWADQFEQGIGRVCQERLLALDRRSPHNWLDDNFWADKAYLECRAPLLVNSNWWLAFGHDDLIPKEAMSATVGITPWQVRRAAWLIHRTLEYKDTLAMQEPSDNTRTGVWLRENTARMFNTGRIPRPHCDTLSSTPTSDNIVVMIHNWFYLVRVNSSSHTLLPPQEIEKRLRSVVRDATARLASGEQAVPIGVLSADNRDRWASNLHHLLSLSQVNYSTHEAILRSLVGLSLDHTTHYSSMSGLDDHLHAIRSTPENVSNRFFDKALTIIVDPATRAGAMGEHSPCDALVPSIVAEYAIVQGVDPDAFRDPCPLDFWTPSASASEQNKEESWRRLDWVTDSVIEQECEQAHIHAKSVIENSDDSVLLFVEYGTDWIKNIATLSPDAYIQMALQLAWYKSRGELTATYETALTRMFQHGRTETIRTLTTDSRAFVLGMMDPSVSLTTRYTLLRRAVHTHAALTREAATGRGIDRHFLGLRLMLRPTESEHESARLLKDELFTRSMQWKLSTSGLSAGYLFRGTGFGAAYEDGYGINYLAAPDKVKFGIESKHSSTLTSTVMFKELITQSLKEMREVCGRACLDSPDTEQSTDIDGERVRSHL